MNDTSSAQPKYIQIAEELRRSISNGTYAPDSRLPGENDLMARFEVARETARKALAQLINEGVAVPRRGAGVFVRAYRPIIRDGIQRLSGTWPVGKSIWAEESQGRQLAVQLRHVREDDAPSHVALLLDLPEGERVLLRDRLYLLDGKPVLSARSYLPAKIVTGSAIAQPDTGPGGTYARLQELGYAPSRFREDLRARMPEPSETQDLELAAGTPVVEIIRTAYTDEGQAIEVNEMVADSSAYVFRYQF